MATYWSVAKWTVLGLVRLALPLNFVNAQVIKAFYFSDAAC
jgi:hypothetical protein